MADKQDKEIVRFYGPYFAKKENRRIVILFYSDGTKKTTSYAKYLYESAHGSVPIGMEVDHIDNNKTNDALENLQVIPIGDNRRKGKTPKEIFTFTCPVCGKLSMKLARNVRGNKKKNRNGPFCSRSCAGKFQFYEY